MNTSFSICRPTFAGCLLLLLASFGPARAALADAFDDYEIRTDAQFHFQQLSPELEAPTMFDVLSDGRIVGVATAGTSGAASPHVLVETEFGSRTFADAGALDLGGGTWPDFGAAFVSVSPDGGQIAVGDNNGRIGVFSSSFTAGSQPVTWYDTSSYFPFQAKWLNETQVGFTYFSGLAALDVGSSPASPTVHNLVTGIDGASGDLAVDGQGYLYTANGFDFTSGGSTVGEIRRFAPALWQPALTGGPAADFLSDGEYFTTYLSGSSLQVDNEQNLIIGGADRNQPASELNRFGVMRIADQALREFDPNTVNNQDGNNYTLFYNRVTDEIYAYEPFTLFFGVGSVDNTLVHVVSPVPFLLGDMNGDGVTNNFDIQPFEIALTNVGTFGAAYPHVPDFRRRGDVDDNGMLNNFDIQPFENLLTSMPGGAAAVPEPSGFVLVIVGLLGLVFWSQHLRDRNCGLRPCSTPQSDT